MKMKFIKHLLAIFAATGVSTAVYSDDAHAEYQREAELECNRALELGTIEALEEYLRKYRFANTNCRVLALRALNNYSPSSNAEELEKYFGGNAGGYGG